MPRRHPFSSGGLVFHVLNRGVRKQRLFDSPGDYDAFVGLLGAAQKETPIRLLAYCLMPNHFHLVLWPAADGDLSTFMLWLSGTHAKRRHVAQGTRGTGPIYQGRFKSFPVANDRHFLCVCRYVERNPLRAGLVTSAQSWNWSSLAQRLGRGASVDLSEWPVERPRDWLAVVNEGAPSAAETELVRKAIATGAPLGPRPWVLQVARQLGIERSLHQPGRPKKGAALSLPYESALETEPGLKLNPDEN